MPKPPPRAKSTDHRPAGRAAAGWLEWTLLAAAAVYFVAFFWADASRVAILGFAVIPDEVVRFWIGHDFSRCGLLDRVPLIIVAAAILLVTGLTGRLLLEALRADAGLTRLERFVFSCGVGLNVWSLYTLVVGLQGGLRYRWLLFAPAPLVLVAAALRWKKWARAVPLTRRASPDDDEPPRWWQRTMLGLAVPFLVVILLGSLLPAWHFDAREYHLQIPKEWFQQGYAGFVPHNVYGNMPLGAEMHALLAMALTPREPAWWWGAVAGKTVIATFALLTALAIYACGRRYFSRSAAALAALAFVSTPWVAFVSMAGLIEVASAFYVMLAVQATLLWWRPWPDAEGGAPPPPRLPLLLLAGFCAGSAVACKYPAVLFVVAPLLLFVVCTSRGAWRWKAGLIFLLAVFSACGLWFGKNWVLAHNPTYPLLYEVFGGRTRTPEKHQQWSRAHRTPRDGEGRSFSPSQLVDSVVLLGLTSQYASVLLVPFGVAAWFSRRHRRLVWLLTGMLACGFLGWWLLTHRVDRFLVPLLPLACLLVGVGATRSTDARWRGGVLALVVVSLLFSFLLVTSRATGDNRYFVALEDLSDDIPREVDEFYSHVHPAHYLLNHSVQPGNRALLVGEAQAFNLRVPVLYNTCFDDCVFESLMRGRSTEQRRAVLREYRISHVFVYWRELDRYRSPGNYGYSDFVTRERIREEFVATGLLREMVLPSVPADNSQVFEVVGWRDWEGASP